MRVCASPSSTQSFCRKRGEIFFKRMKIKANFVAFLCASLSLSLSLCFLSHKRSSLRRRREEESSREMIRVFFFFFSFACSSSRPSPLLWGSFTRDDTTAGCVWGAFCSLPRVFSFCCSFLLLFGQSSVLSFACTCYFSPE